MDMITFELVLSDLQLDKNAIYDNLGYHGQLPDDQIIQMVDDIIYGANEFCKPRTGYCLFNDIGIDQQFININNVQMKTGYRIAGYMMSATIIAAFVATAGKEYDIYLQNIKSEGDIVAEFFTDAVATEITEATVRYVTEKINKVANGLNLMVTNSYSPGYCDWHVSEQKQLFSLFPEKPCGIELNQFSLMHPVKSLSGIIGLGTNIGHTPYACEICGMKGCFKRKKKVKE